MQRIRSWEGENANKKFKQTYKLQLENSNEPTLAGG